MWTSTYRAPDFRPRVDLRAGTVCVGDDVYRVRASRWGFDVTSTDDELMGRFSIDVDGRGVWTVASHVTVRAPRWRVPGPVVDAGTVGRAWAAASSALAA